MKYFRLMQRRLNADRRAVTAIEYALIASLVAVVIVGALNTLSGGITTVFTNTTNDLK